jgi:hypothetical protein
LYCFPIDLAAAAVNVSGLKDGANVTIQVLFNGGDGNLYQVGFSISLFVTMIIETNVVTVRGLDFIFQHDCAASQRLVWLYERICYNSF